MQKRKIPISAPQAPLQSPFAHLDILPISTEENSRSSSPPPPPLQKIWLILSKEKKCRAGKTVTIVSGFPPEFDTQNILALAKEARSACACGGTVEERKILLQGEKRECVRAFLESKGFKIKRLNEK